MTKTAPGGRVAAAAGHAPILAGVMVEVAVVEVVVVAMVVATVVADVLVLDLPRETWGGGHAPQGLT